MAITYTNPVINNISGDPNLDNLKTGSDKINTAFSEISSEFQTVNQSISDINGSIDAIDDILEGLGTAAEADVADLLDRANHTGTQTLSTISDAGTAAAANLNNLVQQDSPTGAAQLPAGTEAERPSVEEAGMIRYNSEFDSFEGYSAGGWSGLGGATGGAGNPAFYENDSVITASYTISTGKNAMSAGPIEIAEGVEVVVNEGSEWSIV
jgi:hypothetical protein